jgi:ribonuclease E
VSRRIEGEDRQELKQALDQLEYPNGMSIIARTAGIGREASELQWDLNYLLKLWSAIDGAAQGGKGAYLIYQESSLVIRAIRDYFNGDIGEILIDTDDIFEQAHQFMSHVMPEHGHRVKRYRDDAPLFSRFQIEHQIETAYSRIVQLPSGGAIVIDQTEALVAVDVNSARAIKGGDIEETATRTNLEAADEVARQARLRDLGGLIVIDFIDMEESKNRREVENRLRDALRQDRARVQFSTISKFGLLEMSRQRLKPMLSEGASIPCPRCGGSGHIRDTESSALQILRVIQEESLKDSTAAVFVQVPVEVASFLLNEKRTEITKIELKQRINVLLVPNKAMDTPNYKLERLKHDDPRLDNLDVSYKLAEEIEDPTTVTRRSQEPTNKQTPVIKGVLPDAPAPVASPKPAAKATPAGRTPSKAPATASTGFFGWIKNLLGLDSAPAPKAPERKRADGKDARPESRGGERRDGGRGRNGGRGEPRVDGRNANREGRGGERNERVEGTRGEARPVEGREPRRNDRNAEGRDKREPREGRDNNRRRETSRESTNEVQLNAPADAQNANETSDNTDGRRERRGRGERGERAASRSTETPATHPALDSETPAAPANDDGSVDGEATPRNRERRSRDRYGRDRRERAPREDGTESADTSAPAEAPNIIVSATSVSDEAPTRSYFNLANTEASPATPTAQQAPVVAAAPTAKAKPERNTTVGSTASMPKIAAYTLSVDDMMGVAQAAGLQWVLSDADKVRQAQIAIANTPKPVHVPREPKPAVVMDTGPLVLVETRQDLKNANLPF